MRVLYVGAKSGTSVQRARAAERLGHQVTHVDPYTDLPHRWALWLNRTGGPGIDGLVARCLARRILVGSYDLAHIDSGDVIGRRALAVIRGHAPVVSLYNADNPWADPAPERRRWTLLHRALPGIDLAAAIRRPGQEAQMRARGVRRPMLTPQTADEVAHAPVPDIDHPWRSKVCFVGTWMPGREDFMATLLDAGINLAIYGGRWERAPNIARLRPHLRGHHLEGRDYARAVAGAQIALVILNARNGDLHTTRSAEIPAIGTAMCALRTAEHLAMYQDDTEAIFFDNAADCATQCKAWLADPARLALLAAAGHARALANRNFNEPLMARIFAAAIQAKA